MAGDLETLKILITTRTTDQNPVIYEYNSGAKSTVLHEAAYYGHLEVIQLLMSKMTDNPNPPRHDGCTPLHFAAHQGHIEIVKLLMSAMSFDGNPNAPNNAGFTPRDAALRNNHQDIAALLLNE